MNWATLGAGDAFALAMLGVIALSFATVLVLLVSMLRHSSRRDPEVERLIEEAREEAGTASENSPGPQPAPWEKPADWWQ